eukprot:1682630-Prymnesium_polylepis.1
MPCADTQVATSNETRPNNTSRRSHAPHHTQSDIESSTHVTTPPTARHAAAPRGRRAGRPAAAAPWPATPRPSARTPAPHPPADATRRWLMGGGRHGHARELGDSWATLCAAVLRGVCDRALSPPLPLSPAR